MNDLELACNDPERRRQVRRKKLNGLDYLEVSDDHLVLTVHFLQKAPEQVALANVRIEGGARVRNIKVTAIRFCREDDPELDDCMQLTVDRPGDFSTYTLRIVGLEEFDRRYSSLKFSFTVGCPSDLDCLPDSVCPPEPLIEPEISYLAKDYGSFRQLILDRLALIMPDWQERHLPDLGITLVELLAYVGDYLSYYQDAVATEAYLGTARRRVSVRRHARLVDYRMHEGCNARAWVFVETKGSVKDLKPKDFYFITGRGDTLQFKAQLLQAEQVKRISAQQYEVFEPVEPERLVSFYEQHNCISFWTWGDRECCLPRGATSATLKDGLASVDAGTKPSAETNRPGAPALTAAAPSPQKQAAPAAVKPAPPGRLLQLSPGDVLIFEEVIGPRTGAPADADSSHRQAVRLTRVETDTDELYDQPIVNIEWAAEDALTFPLCLSATVPPCCDVITDVSVARGNVILVDHGRTLEPPETWHVLPPAAQTGECVEAGEPVENVQPAAPLQFVTDTAYQGGKRKEGERYPRLAYGPLTYRAPYPEPAMVARRQAERIDQIPSRVRELLAQWLKQAEDPALTTAAEAVHKLTVLFGAKAMSAAGLSPKTGTPAHPPNAASRHKALEILKARQNELLAKKFAFLQTLADRARAGYLLGTDEEQDIAELFGKESIEEGALASSDPRFAGSAAGALRQDPRAAQPCIGISETRVEHDDIAWEPRYDLLDSGPEDRHFVAELESDGIAQLRFGDGELGGTPAPDSLLNITYRVGNGTPGNTGAETISHIVFRQLHTGLDLRPRNPLPAVGGTDPEPLEQARLFAPTAFRKQLQRAITAGDYARLAEQFPGVRPLQRVAASLSWTGSWYEVQVAVDPKDSEDADAALRAQIASYLRPYRRIGHDVSVTSARYVPLDIELQVCVLPHYQRGHVKTALQEVFGNQLRPDGSLGFFHPDNLTFGDNVYLSKLVAAALAVTGVESVAVKKLQRQFAEPNNEIESGILPLGPLEIAQLDNDRSFPERGVLRLTMRGGR